MLFGGQKRVPFSCPQVSYQIKCGCWSTWSMKVYCHSNMQRSFIKLMSLENGTWHPHVRGNSVIRINFPKEVSIFYIIHFNKWIGVCFLQVVGVHFDQCLGYIFVPILHSWYYRNTVSGLLRPIPLPTIWQEPSFISLKIGIIWSSRNNKHKVNFVIVIVMFRLTLGIFWLFYYNAHHISMYHFDYFLSECQSGSFPFVIWLLFVCIHWCTSLYWCKKNP